MEQSNFYDDPNHIHRFKKDRYGNYYITYQDQRTIDDLVAEFLEILRKHKASIENLVEKKATGNLRETSKAVGRAIIEVWDLKNGDYFDLGESGKILGGPDYIDEMGRRAVLKTRGIYKLILKYDALYNEQHPKTAEDKMISRGNQKPLTPERNAELRARARIRVSWLNKKPEFRVNDIWIVGDKLFIAQAAAIDYRDDTDDKKEIKHLTAKDVLGEELYNQILEADMYEQQSKEEEKAMLEKMKEAIGAGMSEEDAAYMEAEKAEEQESEAEPEDDEDED